MNQQNLASTQQHYATEYFSLSPCGRGLGRGGARLAARPLSPDLSPARGERSWLALTLLLALTMWLGACGSSEKPAAGETSKSAAGHGEAGPEGEIRKGPHGGRLLEDGGFALEITIFERGVPPEFRVYPTQDGKPIAPGAVTLNIELHRLGGVVDRIAFAHKDDYLLSNIEVYEPHSFDVKLSAQHAGQPHSWNYESYEGRTRIAADMARSAGIETMEAAPGVIEERVTLYGSIQANPERLRQVTARFPGMIRSVNKKAGDAVAQGDTLATIESNESLQTYAVTAPISGIITQRHANPGEAAGAGALFEVADFSSLRAELNVFPRDRGRLQRGQNVKITAADGPQTGEGQIDFVSPVGAAGAQSLVLRVTLDNRDRRWTPGQFVEGLVSVSQNQVPLLVPVSALQTFRDWNVVFLNVGEDYQARPLELGRNDGERVEVLAGLKPGERFVSANSYLVKADIEKSGASHDH